MRWNRGMIRRGAIAASAIVILLVTAYVPHVANAFFQQRLAAAVAPTIAAGMVSIPQTVGVAIAKGISSQQSPRLRPVVYAESESVIQATEEGEDICDCFTTPPKHESFAARFHGIQ